MNRIAVYYRVSTDEQDLASQKVEVERWLKIQELKEEITVTEFKDNGYSGKNTRRPGYRALMKQIEAREFDTLAVFHLDRISRSTFDAQTTMLKLDACGVCLVSVSQPAMNLERDHPFRATMFAMFADMAQLERDMISKRTKAGLAEARRKGRILGRKKVGTPKQLATITAMRAEGISYDKIAEATGLSVPKVFYYVKESKVLQHKDAGLSPAEIAMKMKMSQRQVECIYKQVS